MMHFPGWGSFPVILALALIVVEVLAGILQGRLNDRGRDYLTMCLWTLRPWFAWSLISLVFRSWPQLAFNEPETFPFYADPWDSDTAVLSRIATLALRPAFWACALSALCILVILCATGVRLLRRISSAGRVAVYGPPLLCVLTLAFSLTVNSLPSGWSRTQTQKQTQTQEEGSFLRSWRNPSATLWPAARKITGARDHLRRFLEYQHRLGVHGRSHPPGASLSLFWIGRIMAWGSAPTPYHYAVGLAMIASISGIFVYLLGRMLFSPQVGVCAAMLWGLSPATTIYSVFAQESLYAVFFNAALCGMWMTATSERPWRWGLTLGVVFACMAMLNYSWSVAATMFVVFTLWDGRKRGKSPIDVGRRVVLPMTVFLLLFVFTLVAFRLDYITMYRNAYRHVATFYSLSGLYQHAMALGGGQLGVLLMMGSLCGSAFIASAFRLAAKKGGGSAASFLGSVLAVYCVPLLMVPAVRVEAARQWNWVATLPIVFAASLLLEKRGGKPTWIIAACCVSGLTAIVMRVFLVFWG
jgi:hypothetical protein